ncbi:MAG TPA: hypothetical protein VJI75_01950 [Candidatus Nanoarchaeia archaeon]|nr:hypothetical protein [Candidatus Nanoarchaeia archaeon]
MAKNKPSLQNICNAGEYFIASVLSANGFVTTVTLGRAEMYDLIAISYEGKTVLIQVKTAWYKNNTHWRLQEKSAHICHEKFFYAFVRLNEMKETPEYWIIPSRIVAEQAIGTHKLWLKTPGKKGQAHNDNPGRRFKIVKDKYSPKQFNINDINKGYNNVDYLLEFDKPLEDAVIERERRRKAWVTKK